jgi:hypothetical protein
MVITPLTGHNSRVSQKPSESTPSGGNTKVHARVLSNIGQYLLNRHAVSATLCLFYQYANTKTHARVLSNIDRYFLNRHAVSDTLCLFYQYANTKTHARVLSNIDRYFLNRHAVSDTLCLFYQYANTKTHARVLSNIDRYFLNRHAVSDTQSSESLIIEPGLTSLRVNIYWMIFHIFRFDLRLLELLIRGIKNAQNTQPENVLKSGVPG